MILNNTLLNLVKHNNILLYHVPYPKKVGGQYFFKENNHYITINDYVPEDTHHYNSILAEELGHYYTSYGEHLPSTHNTYDDKVKLDRTELYAAKWACDYTIQDQELLAHIRDNHLTDFEEIAEYFHINKMLLLKKFEFMALKDPYSKLDDHRILCLDSLPNIYILEIID